MKSFGKILILSLMIILVISNKSFARKQETPLSQLPKKVINTVKNDRPGITLRAATLVKESRKIFYAIEATFNGKEYEFQVTPAGKFLESSYETLIFQNEIPEKVLTAAKKAVQKFELIRAKTITKSNGELLYTLECKNPERRYVITITPEGKVIKTTLAD